VQKKYLAWLSEKKALYLATAELICNGCPREFHQMYDALMKLTYYDAPDYKLFWAAIEAVNTRKNLVDTIPLDWEPEAEMYRLIGQVPEGNVLHENKGTSRKDTTA